MRKEELKLILDRLEKFEKNRNKWIVVEYTDDLFSIIDDLLKQIFNKDQYEWINWWVWENDFGNKKLKGFQQINNVKVDIDSFDNLWLTIEFFNKTKDLHWTESTENPYIVNNLKK